MTAEIGILNKSAVALAADSAVAVQQPKGQKIYNSANRFGGQVLKHKKSYFWKTGLW